MAKSGASAIAEPTLDPTVLEPSDGNVGLLGEEGGADGLEVFDNPFGNYATETPDEDPDAGSADNPDGKELAPEVEQKDDTKDGEDGKPEDKPDSARHWQSQYDKLKSQFDQVAPIIEGLKNDPEAARLVFERWSSGGRQKEEVAPPAEPTPPDDFDPMLMFTPGTSSYKFMQDQKRYDREILKRELAGEVESRVGEKLKPIEAERQAAAVRAQQVGVLKKTPLPAEHYDEFLGWKPSPEALTEAFMRERGLIVEQKGKKDAKVEEFKRVKENGAKPGALAKPGGGGNAKPTSESEGFFAGLAGVAPRY